MNNLENKLIQVNRFWFEELDEKDWWTKSNKLDSNIKTRFGELHQLLIDSDLEDHTDNPELILAKIIVLDQFSRNIYRDSPKAFAYDDKALALAQRAVTNQHDIKLSKSRRLFIYMPYMHSESLTIHDEAVKLFEVLGLETNLKFEHAHRDIIKRFGRYPHRNKILNRQSTDEETEFLKEPGSSF